MAPMVVLNGVPIREARRRLRQSLEATRSTARRYELTPVSAQIERERVREKVRGTIALRGAILDAVTTMREPFLAGLRKLRQQGVTPTHEAEKPEPDALKDDPWTLQDYLDLALTLDATALEIALRAAMGDQYAFGVGHAEGELGSVFDDPRANDAAKAALEAQAIELADSVEEDEAEAVRDMIGQAFDDGIGARDLGIRIAAFFEDGVHRLGSDGIMRAMPVDSWAETVARTEIARAQNVGIVTTYKAAAVETIMWVCAEDERSCDECDDLDGQTTEIGTEFEDGVELPPDPHPSCRCTVIAAGFADGQDQGDGSEDEPAE